MFRTVCLGSLALLCALPAQPVRAEKKPTTRDALAIAAALDEALQAVIKEAEPSVVCILVSRSPRFAEFGQGPSEDTPGLLGGFDYRKIRYLNALREVKGPRRELAERLALDYPDNVPESYGSGVVIDADKRLILTNYHVVRGATKVYVRVPGGKGSYANILAADHRSDLAVLDLIDKIRLKEIRLADGRRPINKGQQVVLIANPYAAGFRDGSPSASWGTVSNVRRRVPSKNPREYDFAKTLHHYGTLLQVDARINLGSSGGALVNLDGELIGLTTALAALTGVDRPGGYAVPLDDGFQHIIDVLKKGREANYGFLGVLPARGAGGPGIVLGGVSDGSPAWKAGLRAGDTIVAINGHPTRTSDQLFLALGMHLTGEKVKVKFQRATGAVVQDYETEVTLGKFFVEGKIIARNRPTFRGLRVDYTTLLVQGRFITREDIPRGVMVAYIQSNTPAANAPLKVGDVIFRVNNQRVNSPDEFYRALQGVRGSVELTLEDGSGARVVKIG
jgi:S1-C subfamily serine protease